MHYGLAVEEKLGNGKHSIYSKCRKDNESSDKVTDMIVNQKVISTENEGSQ